MKEYPYSLHVLKCNRQKCPLTKGSFAVHIERGYPRLARLPMLLPICHITDLSTGHTLDSKQRCQAINPLIDNMSTVQWRVTLDTPLSKLLEQQGYVNQAPANLESARMQIGGGQHFEVE